MKKAYVKPYIAVESFQLDAAIASSCSSEGKLALHFYLNTCDAEAENEAPGLHYFGDVCIHDVQVEGDGNDLICYHGPTTSAFDVAMNS